MRRRGGKRKLGRREPCGRLSAVRRGPSVEEVAASMPHRRELKERANLDGWALRGSSRCWRPPGRTMRGISGGTSRAFVQSPCSAAPIAAERWARCG